MSAARTLLAVTLFLIFGVPVLAPLGVAAQTPGAFAALRESDRLLSLLSNTVGLAAVAGAVAVPLGTLLAVLVRRGPVRGRGVLRAAVLVALFMPLPVYAVAWQTVLGGWLPSLALEPGAVAWRAWSVGLLPAGFVHGMAGLPWVAWVVSEALARTDRDLEDDAAQTGGMRAVLRRVLLPRTMLAAAVAGGWVGVQTATEIPVSDAMMVRTFAEEVYTQTVSGSGAAGIASAVAVAVPVWLAGVLVGLPVLRRVKVSPESTAPRPLRFPAWVTLPATVFAWGIVLLFAGVPLAALVWKASGDHHTVGELVRQLDKVISADGGRVGLSILWAAVTGIAVAWAARRACGAAARNRWFAGFLFVLGVSAFLIPGPLVGFGLKEVIRRLVLAEDALFATLGVRPSFPPLASLLYDQPSPVPAMWAAAVRLFPVACVVLWPAVRAIPRELWDAAAVDGHGRGGEWRLVVAPFTRGAFGRAAVAVAALALCEVSAGKVVTPPGYESFVMWLFTQMHYGAESTVAALCLMQVAVSAAAAGALGWAGSLTRR